MDADVFNQMVEDKARMVEQCVVGCIESIEDRVPNDEELKLFMLHRSVERGEHWFWKERLIVAVAYWPKPGVPYMIFSLVNPFAPVTE